MSRLPTHADVLALLDDLRARLAKDDDGYSRIWMGELSNSGHALFEELRKIFDPAWLRKERPAPFLNDLDLGVRAEVERQLNNLGEAKIGSTDAKFQAEAILALARATASIKRAAKDGA